MLTDEEIEMLDALIESQIEDLDTVAAAHSQIHKFATDKTAEKLRALGNKIKSRLTPKVNSDDGK